MVTRAQAVFVGQTLDVHSRWVSTSSGRAIVTVVTFKVIRTLKGELGGQTQLEFLGGTVGDYRLEVPGIPRFRVGDEDVLFVDERGQPVSPVVGFMHGRFRVLEEPGTGRRSVARHDFEPLARVADIGASHAAGPRVVGPGPDAGGLRRRNRAGGSPPARGAVGALMIRRTILLSLVLLAAAAGASQSYWLNGPSWPSGAVPMQIELGASPALTDGCADWSCAAARRDRPLEPLRGQGPAPGHRELSSTRRASSTAATTCSSRTTCTARRSAPTRWP